MSQRNKFYNSICSSISEAYAAVTAIPIIVISMDEIGRKCYEDDNTLQVQETVELADELINSKWFKDTPKIIVYNIFDETPERLLKIGFLNENNKNFKSDKEVLEQGLSIIHKMVLKVCPEKSVPIIHCAVNLMETENVQAMMEHVTETLKQKSGNAHLAMFTKKSSCMFTKMSAMKKLEKFCNVTIDCALEKKSVYKITARRKSGSIKK